MESIYGKNLPRMEAVLAELNDEIIAVREKLTQLYGMDPVEHCLMRIKSEESMREKCARKGLPETMESALTKLYDGIGLRVVCAFRDDVYAIRDHLVSLPNCQVVEEKDYIRHAKPNGYRSYHLILKVHPAHLPEAEDGQPSEGLFEDYYAEIQLRTISMDTWAALEHHLYYKKNVVKNSELLKGELKRCADELASTDISMQTIRDMLYPKEEAEEADQP